MPDSWSELLHAPLLHAPLLSGALILPVCKMERSAQVFSQPPSPALGFFPDLWQVVLYRFGFPFPGI